MLICLVDVVVIHNDGSADVQSAAWICAGIVVETQIVKLVGIEIGKRTILSYFCAVNLPSWNG